MENKGKAYSSYYETKAGDIFRLNEIVCINKNSRYVELNGGLKILFAKDEINELENIISEFKNIRDYFDHHEILRIEAENKILIRNNLDLLSKLRGDIL